MSFHQSYKETVCQIIGGKMANDNDRFQKTSAVFKGISVGRGIFECSDSMRIVGGIKSIENNGLNQYFLPISKDNIEEKYHSLTYKTKIVRDHITQFIQKSNEELGWDLSPEAAEMLVTYIEAGVDAAKRGQSLASAIGGGFAAREQQRRGTGRGDDLPPLPTYEELERDGKLYSQAFKRDRSITIIDHLKAVWMPWIEAGVLTRPELFRRDKSAYKGLENWMAKHKEDGALEAAIGSKILNRSESARRDLTDAHISAVEDAGREFNRLRTLSHRDRARTSLPYKGK